MSPAIRPEVFHDQLHPVRANTQSEAIGSGHVKKRRDEEFFLRPSVLGGAVQGVNVGVGLAEGVVDLVERGPNRPFRIVAVSATPSHSSIIVA